ncbi:PLP-dependent transferase [Auriculariales sp. MPI-PUGE-AT-0066]|nr:PLP-dependent transferase [Auriculariales sp. MPI-PUGE-AT-0066]
MASSDCKSEDPLELSIRNEVMARPNSRLRDQCAEQLLANFSSDDFLSLSTNDEFSQHFLQRLASMNGGAHILFAAQHHIAVEARIARIWTVDKGLGRSRLAALFFPTGYIANLGFWSTLPQEGDVVICDELIHSSVDDGLRLGLVGRGRAQAKRFQHNDLDDLRRVLQADADAVRAGKMQNHCVFVAVESLYGMTGDRTNLSEILALVRPFGKRVKVVVDEAHALGVFQLGLSMPPYVTPEETDEIFARTITFSGLAGAAVVVPQYVKPYLATRAKRFTFSTTPTVSSFIAVDCALDMLEDGKTAALAQKLQSNIRALLHLLHTNLTGVPTCIASVPIPAPGLDDNIERSPIIPILTPFCDDESDAVALGRHLHIFHGSIVDVSSYPEVAQGIKCVRVCLTAGHSREQMEALARGVGEWARMQLPRDAKLNDASVATRAKSLLNQCDFGLTYKAMGIIFFAMTLASCK